MPDQSAPPSVLNVIGINEEASDDAMEESDDMTEDPPTGYCLIVVLNRLERAYGPRLTSLALTNVSTSSEVFLLPPLPRAKPFAIYQRFFKPVCLLTLGKRVVFERDSRNPHEMPTKILMVIGPNTLAGVLAGSCMFDNDGNVLAKKEFQFWQSIFHCFDTLIEIYSTAVPSPYVPRDILGRVIGRSDLDIAEEQLSREQKTTKKLIWRMLVPVSIHLS